MAEGILDETSLSNDSTLKDWLNQWELSKLENALNKQGIKTPNDFKFIKSQAHFDKLLSKLNADLTFMDEMRLEEAWKSIQTNIYDKPKMIFVGNEEKEIMEKLHKKYDNVSDDINVIQKAINDLNQSAVQCKQSLNDNLNKMIEVIEKKRRELTKEIENKQNLKQKEMNEWLNKMKYIRQIYSKRKKEFDIIVSKSDISTSTKIQKLKQLLIINVDNDNDEKEFEIQNLPSHVTLTNNIKHKEFDIKTFNKYVGDTLSIQQNVTMHELVGINLSEVKFCAKQIETKLTVEQNGKLVIFPKGVCAAAYCEPGFSKGEHKWEIKLEKGSKCSAAIGISSKLHAKFSGSYRNMDGNEFAYTWRADEYQDLYGSTDGEKCFDKKVNKKWTDGETVKVILNVDEGYVEFIYRNDSLGRIPIEQNRVYYPCVHVVGEGRFSIV
eukprot:148830_1